jgi:hypothetical protein
VFAKEDFDLRDLCCTFENQLWLERKCLSDQDFATKFGKSLEDLSEILKQINFRQEFSEKALSRLSRRFKGTLESFYLPKRNLKEAKRQCNGQFQFLDSFSPGISKYKLPPKSYVGKGYRDKGSVRNTAKDGSPRWQEIAMHRGPLYHKGKEIKNEHETVSRAEEVSRFIADTISGS